MASGIYLNACLVSPRIPEGVRSTAICYFVFSGDSDGANLRVPKLRERLFYEAQLRSFSDF
jgi:hypothetical protein